MRSISRKNNWLGYEHVVYASLCQQTYSDLCFLFLHINLGSSSLAKIAASQVFSLFLFFPSKKATSKDKGLYYLAVYRFLRSLKAISLENCWTMGTQRRVSHSHHLCVVKSTSGYMCKCCAKVVQMLYIDFSSCFLPSTVSGPTTEDKGVAAQPQF